MTEVPREGDGSAPARVPTPWAATRFLLAIAALFLVGGAVLQILLGEAALAIGQIVLVVVPTLLFVRRGGYDAFRTLSLRLPSGAEVGGGLLLLLGGIQVASILAWLQTFFLPIPTDYLEGMSEMLAVDSAPRLLWILFVAAVLPAVAEEGVFRGVFLSALRTRLPGVWAALLSGAVFGLFHLLPGTVFRFLPTAWLGVLFGLVVVVTASLPLAVLLHFLNNAVVIVLPLLVTMTGEEMADPLTDPLAGPPIWAFPLGVVFLVWGARILLAEAAGRAGGAPAHASESAGEGGTP